MNRGEDTIDGSDPGDEGSGVLLLTAVDNDDAWETDVESHDPLDLSSTEEQEA